MPTPPLIMPVAPYAPDQPALAGQASANTRNVIPRTSKSYGPVGAPSVYSSALPARCQGLVGLLDSAGNVNLFSGDATDLFRITSGTTTWTNVSGTTSPVTITIASPAVITWNAHGLSVGSPIIFSTTGALPTGIVAGTQYFIISAGFGVNAFEISTTLAGSAVNTSGSQSGTQTATAPLAGTYAIASTDQWQWTYFNGDIIATDFVDPPQYFTLSSSSWFAALPGSPPKGRYVATVKNAFVVFGNTFDSVSGNAPQRVWWSAAGNAKAGGWPTPGTAAAAQVQSGFTDLLGNAGWVQAIAAPLSNADAAIFQEYGVRRMVYAGPPDVFDFLPAENVRGTPSPYSVVVANGNAYYLGQDGFYGFDGVDSQPIGLDQVDATFWGIPVAGPDAVDQSNLNRVIGAADPLNRVIWWAYPASDNVNGNPTRLLGYHWGFNRWCLVQITIETLGRLLSLGYTLDQLWTVLGFTIDDLPAPLDSRVWTGGKLLFGVFDTNHKLNYLTGPNLAAIVETQEIQPFRGRRTLITGARPWVDGGTPSVQIGHRETLQSSVTYTPAVAVNKLGLSGVRTSGRYTRGVITTNAGDVWSNLSGIELNGKPQGSR